MKKIRVITGFPLDPQHPFRVLEDLLPYQDEGVVLSLSHNTMGPIHCQSEIEQHLASAGMAQAALAAEAEGVDAIVIESMGDTGLIPCREAVNIPVIGLSDVSMRVAAMLGRKFGIITVGSWHGYALERVAKLYELYHFIAGLQPLHVQPFFTDVPLEEILEQKLVEAALVLITQKAADVLILGGSYFLGKSSKLAEKLALQGYHVPILDPLPLAIRFAAILVASNLVHNKHIYANPSHATKVIGYSAFSTVPGVNPKSY